MNQCEEDPWIEKKIMKWNYTHCLHKKLAVRKNLRERVNFSNLHPLMATSRLLQPLHYLVITELAVLFIIGRGARQVPRDVCTVY